MKLDLKVWINKATDAIKRLAYDSNDQLVYQNYCKYRKKGSVVHVWGQSSGGFNIATGDYRALTTLPQEARPGNEIIFPCGALGGDAQITCKISTNGIVALYSTKNASYLSFSTCYIVGG